MKSAKCSQSRQPSSGVFWHGGGYIGAYPARPRSPIASGAGRETRVHLEHPFGDEMAGRQGPLQGRDRPGQLREPLQGQGRAGNSIVDTAPTRYYDIGFITMIKL